MAVQAWSPFPPFFRLINGTVLNNLLSGTKQMLGINVASGATISGGLTVTGGATINGGQVIAAATAVPVSATSAAVGPAIPLGIPAGATVISLVANTMTAFTGATVSGCVGSASGDASYVADISIKNGGTVQLLPTTAAGAAAFQSVPPGSGLVFTLSQGTPTSVGSAIIQGGYTV